MNPSSHFDCVLALQSEDLALKHRLESGADGPPKILKNYFILCISIKTLNI